MGTALENNTQSNVKLLDPKRKKRLMKKLEKIKLNRSRGNSTLFDSSPFFELKLRKLKNNNICLAKALADQRQECKAWSDEVMCLREKLMESQHSLRRHKGNQGCCHEDVINSTVSQRLSEFTEPMNTAVQHCLQNVSTLVENLTTIKKVMTSLVALGCVSERASHSSLQGSSGSKPILSRNLKSPRKNVVHPMVEGHVFQPVSISVQRVSLEDRRRYRLQERAESLQDEIMEVITEDSSSPGDTGSNAEEIRETVDSPSSDVPQEQDEPIVTNSIPPSPTENPSQDSNKENIANLDDPLEGSSWMHLRRTKNLRKRKVQSPVWNEYPINDLSDSDEEYLTTTIVSPASSQGRRSKKKRRKQERKKSSCGIGKHNLVIKEKEESTRLSEEHKMQTSQDALSETEIKEMSDSQIAKNDSLNFNENEEEMSYSQIAKNDSFNLNFSHNSSLTINLVRLEELGRHISKRSNIRSSVRSTRSTKESLVVDDHIEEDLPQSFLPIPVNSFIINDTILGCGSPYNLESPGMFAVPDIPATTTNTPLKQISHLTKETAKDKNNFTFLMDSPMDLTECIPMDFLCNAPETLATNSNESKCASLPENPNLPFNGGTTNSGECKDDLSNVRLNTKRKKNNRFFKSGNKEMMDRGSKSTDKEDKSLYDLSMMESTIIDVFSSKTGKENIPPAKVIQNISPNEYKSPMVIRGVSIMVKDIMKSPSEELTSPALETNSQSLEMNSSLKINDKYEEKSRLSNKNSSTIGVSKNVLKPCEVILSAGMKPAKEKTPRVKKSKLNKKKKITKNKETTDNIINNVKLSDITSVVIGENDLIPNRRTSKRTKCSQSNANPFNSDSDKESFMGFGDEVESSTLEVHPARSNHENLIILEAPNTKKEQGEESDPLPISPKKTTHVTNTVPDVIPLSPKNCDAANREVIFVQGVHFTSPEARGRRPRRAALKVSSFKEPSLNTKMRQDKTKKKGSKKQN